MAKFMTAAGYAAQKAAEEALMKEKALKAKTSKFKSKSEIEATKGMTPEELASYYENKSAQPNAAQLKKQQYEASQAALEKEYNAAQEAKAIEAAKQQDAQVREANRVKALDDAAVARRVEEAARPPSRPEFIDQARMDARDREAIARREAAARRGMGRGEVVYNGSMENPSIVDRALDTIAKEAPARSPISALNISPAEKAALGSATIGGLALAPQVGNVTPRPAPSSMALPAGYGSESDADERRMISGGENVDEADQFAATAPVSRPSVDINALIRPPVARPSARLPNVGTATGYSKQPMQSAVEEPGFFAKLFGGNEPVQNQRPTGMANKVINWGNSDSSSDFFRADKELQAKLAAEKAIQDMGSPEGKKAGGSVSSGGEKKQDAIHHALKIISHLIGHK